MWLDSLIVPSGAVVFNSEGLTAAVLEDGVAHFRKISIGRDFGTTVEVRDGLKPGDQVIINPSVDLADGSRVAARSVSDARFLLERAASIHVITVTDEKPLKEKDAGERLAASLREAGLKAEFAAIRAEDVPIAATLQHHAARMGADLLVMGGYGHTRLREIVLGGVSHGVMQRMTVPVLMSH